MDVHGRAWANVKQRETPNDVFYTPLPIVKTMVELIKPFTCPSDFILDPCRGDGRIGDMLVEQGFGGHLQSPDTQISSCEIDDGTDFFDYNKHTDIIIANYPFSHFDKFLEKSIDLKPRVMCLLFGGMNFTPNRINKLASAGYILVEQHQTWWREILSNFVIIAVFEKDAKSAPIRLTIDPTRHKGKD